MVTLAIKGNFGHTGKKFLFLISGLFYYCFLTFFLYDRNIKDLKNVRTYFCEKKFGAGAAVSHFENILQTAR